MNELPIFVQHDGGHLAAVVTMPEQQPRGLVLMLPGASLDETLGSYLLFERAAPRLAERGLASVRMDYFGLGDSTADEGSWSLDSIEAAHQQAETVLAEVERGTNAGPFAVLALCYGGRVGLAMAKRSDCLGVVCLGSPLIEHGGFTQIRRRVGGSGAGSMIRGNALLRRRVVRPLRKLLSERRPAKLVRDAVAELGHARVLALYSETEAKQDVYRMRAVQSLDAISGRLGPDERDRFRVELLPTEPLAGFDQMPEHDQNLVLDRVLDWLDETFADSYTPAESREEVLT
jgi:pimeloyl-ACP methyl ester carboxylesterase